MNILWIGLLWKKIDIVRPEHNHVGRFLISLNTFCVPSLKLGILWEEDRGLSRVRPSVRPSLPPSVRPQLYRRDYPSHLNQIWYGHVSGSGHSSLVTEYHVGQRSRSSQGHRSLLVFWLLCKDLSSNSYQTWYNVCLYYCPLIYDLEVKVISRSKVILVFWLLWPHFFTDFHQNWHGECVNHGK